MKKAIIFLVVLIFVLSFMVGCKNSEVEEIKEQVSKLTEKLDEVETSTELEEIVDEVEASAEREEIVDESKGIEEPISISWREAKYHIGETITVYGPVVATYYDANMDGGTAFLNIGKNYPDPEGFSVWVNSINLSKFSEIPEIYYQGKNISVTGLIVEIDGLPHMEVTDPEQINEDEEAVVTEEEPVKEEDETTKEPVEEPFEEEPVEEEPATETVDETLIAPTISLEIIKGPTFSQLGDNTCYYRVRANVTGSPTPTVSFNKDDSLGSLGGNISQINLHSEGESFTLEATAVNSQGIASDSITLSYNCQRHIPILVINDTGGNITLDISGPANYSFNIPPGQQNIYVIPGTYNYTARGCGGAVETGTEDLSTPGNDWKWWCQ